LKILVTGGAGYIGSHVVLELCENGFEVIVLDDLSSGNEKSIDKRAKFIQGSTLNKLDLENSLKGIETVIHLAAFKAAGESMINPSKYSENNIVGTINLLNEMLNQNIRQFIFSSTAAVYGYPKYLPIDEKHPLDPINYYGFSKLEVEKILQWYGQLKGLRFAILRYFNAAGYDPRGRLNYLEKKPANLIPIVMEVASGTREKLQVFGNNYKTHDGTGVRDYIHVTDLANAHVKALKHLQNSENIIANLATGESHSVFDVINCAKEISEKEILYEIIDRRIGDPAELYAKSTLALDKLKWKAEYSDLNSLIKTTWDIYNQ